MRLSGIIFATGLLGCSAGAIGGPNLDLDDLPATITLAVGEERQVGAAVIRLDGVPADSRCPVDVTCVWEGNAQLDVVVEPAAGRAPSHLLKLNTSLEPRTGSALGLTLTVVALAPAPRSDRPTRGYRAELRVERTAP